MTKTISEILKNAKRREASVTLCLSGDLQAEFEQLEQQRSRMLEDSVTFRFRAVGHREWSDLLAAHPAPEDKPHLRYDVPALVAPVLELSAIDPVMSAKDVTKLLDVLSSAQVDRLFGCAWDLNTEDAGVPFSALASDTLQSSPKK